MTTDDIIRKPILALVGPTAIGKTRLSIDLARKFNCEIVSVDSMQVYRYMDVGTAKISEDEMCGIPHHLIDIVYPDEEYNVSRFVHDATEAANAITAKGRLPLFTGGTGLYLKALFSGLAPGLPEDREVREELQRRLVDEGSSKLHDELAIYDRISAERIHPNDSMRIIRGLEIYFSTGIPWSAHLANDERRKRCAEFVDKSLVIGLTTDRDRLYARINRRTDVMLNTGLEEEVRSLLERGYARTLKSMGAIGYRHMIGYIDGEFEYEEMRFLLARDTRRYAKRQFTWFNGVAGLEWHDVQESEKIVERVADWFKKDIDISQGAHTR